MKGGAPTVSVVIPCFNLGAYLDEAVQSVLNQTYENFEIVIIDDGSTDAATRNLFTSYVRPKTRIVRTENRGLAQARNRGLLEARGSYISFLDADDLYEPAFLDRTVRALEADPSIAFASCWMTAFGEQSFLWKPESCDFPLLLVEDTVCTAALTRRDALEALGGFDPGMPVAGYEDWDLAIGMRESGRQGTIIRELLFRYRVRPAAMSTSCCSPENHGLLMRYMIGKHRPAYERHLEGALEILERKSLEYEKYRPPGRPSDARPGPGGRLDPSLETRLRSVLASRFWQASRPFRLTLGAPRIVKERLRRALARPEAGVVLTCRDSGPALEAAFESVSLQTGASDEIIIVDDGSTDPVTLQILDSYRFSGVRVVRTNKLGPSAARRAGFRKTTARLLCALSSEETFEPGFVRRIKDIFNAHPEISFVSGGFRDADATSFTWAPLRGDLPHVLGCRRFAFPFLRREAFSRIGEYDASLAPEAADWDLMIRLVDAGLPGEFLREPCVSYHVARRPLNPDGSPPASLPPVLRPLFQKHRRLFEAHAAETFWAQDDQRRRLQACAWDPFNAVPERAEVKPIEWGNLRRLEPLSRTWGMDRGRIIDRYYIDEFLGRNRGDIHGVVLEVKDSTYTHRFGSHLEKIEVVDISPENPAATLVADLAAEGSLPAGSYDCAVLTQTIHIIPDVPAVLRNLARALKPGGTVLATLPCVSRIDYESGVEGDYWRFTAASARWLFEKAFGKGNVEVHAYGNVLASCGFLMGASADDLSVQELDYHDPYFPLLVCVRAVKRPDEARAPSIAGAGARDRPAAAPRGVLLLYHRVASPERDRWRLSVSPENFEAQLGVLSRDFEPVPLSRLLGALKSAPHDRRHVSITFDDGYADNWTRAFPILRRFGIPATFFISGDGAAIDGIFWWEILEAAAAELNLADPAVAELHSRLMRSVPEERERVLENLPKTDRRRLALRLSRDQLQSLACEPLAEIGAHGWSHTALGSLSAERQRQEIEDNLRSLREVAGCPIESFAYPFGGPFNAETLSLLRENGIRFACVVGESAVSCESDPLTLPRLEVRDWDSNTFRDRLLRIFGQ